MTLPRLTYAMVSISESFPVGTTVGRWTVTGHARSRVICRCACGNTGALQARALRLRRSVSCGCARRDGVKHGHTSKRGGISPTYSTWLAVRDRCRKPTQSAYRYYGARGIDVCERWFLSFEAFLEDMGERPSRAHSIDRIDNSKGYEPGNCRWATKGEQNRNTSRNRWLEIDGERRTLTDWAAHFAVDPRTVFARVRRGWPTERLFVAAGAGR